MWPLAARRACKHCRVCIVILIPITCGLVLERDAHSADSRRDLAKSFHPATEAYLRRLEAEDRRQGGSSVSLLSASKVRDFGKDTLLVMYSDSDFYETRLSWAKQTWIKMMNTSNLLVIGDQSVDSDFGLDVHQTSCPAHSHWEGACCKYAEAVIEARKRMQAAPSLGWVYFLDDDTYLRPAELARSLAAVPSSGSSTGKVLGYWGCRTQTDHCGLGLCAGGGYAADRHAVFNMVDGNSATFLRQQMAYCSKCDRWADSAVSQIMKDKYLEIGLLDGIYGWAMNKKDFDSSLRNSSLMRQPLLYHNMRNEEQFKFLHNLFVEHPESLSQEMDIRDARDNRIPPCVSYANHTVCVQGQYDKDLPWTQDDKKNYSRVNGCDGCGRLHDSFNGHTHPDKVVFPRKVV